MRGEPSALPALRTSATSDAVAFVACGGGVALLGFARGGYYATTWGWSIIAALVVASAAVIKSKRVVCTRPDSLLLGGLALFILWSIVETIRAGAATHGVPQVERSILYLVVVWAGVQLLARRNADAALAGVLAGIVVVLGSGLATLLLPRVVRADPFEGRLLFLPLGYANACGILATVGVLLALGLAGHAAGRLRGAATASLVPIVVALVLTGSRGAVLAAVAGIAAMVALDATGRGAILTMLYLPIPLLAAVLASHTHVGDAHATTSLVARDGRLVAVVVLGMTAVQTAVAARLHHQTESLRARRHALRGLLGCAATAVISVVVVGHGGMLGDRPAYWHVAWSDVQAHPLLGSGPGSFAAVWLQRRTSADATLNAHNLYLETLAELGPAGLLALLSALAAPLAAIRGRLPTTAAAACGAYVAFLVHAGLDWDWQMPAVTAAALICACCILAARRPDRPHVAHRRFGVDCALACSALLALAAAAASIGNASTAAAARAEQAGAPAVAARLANVASAWQPWSAEPDRLLAVAFLQAGDEARARRAFEQAVALDPTDLAAWAGLVRTGDRMERIHALGELAHLDPFP